MIEVNTDTYRVNAATAIEFNTPIITANASTQVALNTPLVAASTDVKAQGDIYDHNNKSMSGMRQIYNTHTHSDPQGGSVSVPTGQM